MILTVAIPTYDRNAILRKHLALLMPQLTPDCELLIIDNCSPTPVIETIGDLLDSYPEVNARVERNRVNIGAGANLLRCIERCETEWIWVLSDDDLPKPDAIETILKNTEKALSVYSSITLRYSKLGKRPLRPPVSMNSSRGWTRSVTWYSSLLGSFGRAQCCQV